MLCEQLQDSTEEESLQEIRLSRTLKYSSSQEKTVDTLKIWDCDLNIIKYK